MTEPPPLPGWGRRRWILLIVLSANMILDAVEGSILVPSLSVVATALGSPIWQAQWLLSGFAIGFALLLPAGPVMAVRFGRRNVFLAAMAVFALASVVGGLTSSVAVLVGTRVVKGAAAALTAPAGLAVIAAEFPAGAQQRRAISVYAGFGAAGFTAGLLLSGALSAVSWHAIFLFPAPVAALLLAIAWRVLPDAPVTAAARPSMSLLGNASLLRSAVGAAVLNGGYITVLLVLALQLHQAMGWSGWLIAIGLLPASLPLAVSVPFAGRWVGRYGTAAPIFAGAVITFAGQLLLLARPHIRHYPGDALPVLLVIEAGFVLSFAALNMQSTATIGAELRSAAVSLYQAGVQIGAAVLLPIVVYTAYSAGFRTAVAVIAGTGLLAVIVAGAELRSSPRRQAGGPAPAGEPHTSGSTPTIGES